MFPVLKSFTCFMIFELNTWIFLEYFSKFFNFQQCQLIGCDHFLSLKHIFFYSQCEPSFVIRFRGNLEWMVLLSFSFLFLFIIGIWYFLLIQSYIFPLNFVFIDFVLYLSQLNSSFETEDTRMFFFFLKYSKSFMNNNGFVLFIIMT